MIVPIILLSVMGYLILGVVTSALELAFDPENTHPSLVMAALWPFVWLGYSIVALCASTAALYVLILKPLATSPRTIILSLALMLNGNAVRAKREKVEQAK